MKKNRLLDRHLYLVRPLLIFTRQDTREFCKLMNIPIWEDPTNSDLKIKRNLIRKKIIPLFETIYPGCTNRINNFAEKMSNYNNEQNDLGNLAYLSCKDRKGIKRYVLNSLCIEARSTILNTYLRKNCSKQISSKNINQIAYSIYENNKGQINLPERLKIIWNKEYINLEKV